MVNIIWHFWQESANLCGSVSVRLEHLDVLFFIPFAKQLKLCQVPLGWGLLLGRTMLLLPNHQCVSCFVGIIYKKCCFSFCYDWRSTNLLFWVLKGTMCTQRVRKGDGSKPLLKFSPYVYWLSFWLWILSDMESFFEDLGVTVWTQKRGLFTLICSVLSLLVQYMSDCYWPWQNAAISR